MPKHYRPPGKKKEGNAAKYITRTKALKYLQISLQDFRKLCILKGVFPRVPKKKTEGNDKTYYHMKDIAFLAHEPILNTFRDIRAHGHKVNKALAKRNKPRAEILKARKPKYNLGRVIVERYPSFIDALRDLDDCLTLVHLFAALPAADSERIDVKRIRNSRRLSHQWQAYVSRTHSLRKAFIAVKGIVYEAVVQGQRITWITPHALQQVLSDDVDYNVMSTFLEFYEELLGFVNFKLYHSINVRYPPILDKRLEDLAADLYALSRYFASSRVQPLAALEENSNQQENTEVGSKGTESNLSELRLALLQEQLPTNEPGALMQLVEEAGEDDEDIDEETRECKSLFKNMKFFLSREVQREALLFIIPAFGGVVSWEGEGAPFEETEEGITHQIVDRPSQGHMFLSREYVQPQWVFDCVNVRIIIPTEAYMVGKVCPPHLSPFVDNDAEGYTPEYAETIKRMVASSKKEKMPLPLPGFEKDGDDPNNLLVQGLISRKKDIEAAKNANEKKKQMDILQKKYHDELDKEVRGVEYTAPSTIVNTVEEEDESVPDPDEAKMDDEHMVQLQMSKKKRGLYKAMQIGKERKKQKVDILKERKKKSEEKKEKKQKK